MRIEPQVGSWYIVVTCERCHSTLYLFRDLTAGRNLHSHVPTLSTSG
jgi:hypothetical protein